MSHGRTRRDLLGSLIGLAGGAAAFDRFAPTSDGACCYFAAKGKDINQPSQRTFINWDPVAGQESRTVEPKVAGNAEDFGMVIPTPTRPRLDEMPREFFKLLAVFTILEPMPLDKYKQTPSLGVGGMSMAGSGVRSVERTRR